MLNHEQELVLRDWARSEGCDIYLDSLEEQLEIEKEELIDVPISSPNRTEFIAVKQGVIRGIRFAIDEINRLSRREH